MALICFDECGRNLGARILGVDDDQSFGRDSNDRVRSGAGDIVEVGLELNGLLDRIGRRGATTGPAALGVACASAAAAAAALLGLRGDGNRHESDGCGHRQNQEFLL